VEGEREYKKNSRGKIRKENNNKEEGGKFFWGMPNYTGKKN